MEDIEKRIIKRRQGKIIEGLIYMISYVFVGLVIGFLFGIFVILRLV